MSILKDINATLYVLHRYKKINLGVLIYIYKILYRDINDCNFNKKVLVRVNGIDVTRSKLLKILCCQKRNYLDRYVLDMMDVQSSCYYVFPNGVVYFNEEIHVPHLQHNKRMYLTTFHPTNDDKRYHIYRSLNNVISYRMKDDKDIRIIDEYRYPLTPPVVIDYEREYKNMQRYMKTMLTLGNISIRKKIIDLKKNIKDIISLNVIDVDDPTYTTTENVDYDLYIRDIWVMNEELTKEHYIGSSPIKLYRDYEDYTGYREIVYLVRKERERYIRFDDIINNMEKDLALKKGTVLGVMFSMQFGMRVNPKCYNVENNNGMWYINNMVDYIKSLVNTPYTSIDPEQQRKWLMRYDGKIRKYIKNMFVNMCRLYDVEKRSNYFIHERPSPCDHLYSITNTYYLFDYESTHMYFGRNIDHVDMIDGNDICKMLKYRVFYDRGCEAMKVLIGLCDMVCGIYIPGVDSVKSITLVKIEQPIFSVKNTNKMIFETFSLSGEERDGRFHIFIEIDDESKKMLNDLDVNDKNYDRLEFNILKRYRPVVRYGMNCKVQTSKIIRDNILHLMIKDKNNVMNSIYKGSDTRLISLKTMMCKQRDRYNYNRYEKRIINKKTGDEYHLSSDEFERLDDHNIPKTIRIVKMVNYHYH